MKNVTKKFLSLLALVPLMTNAGVNLKNGNFYITYADVNVTGGAHDLEVTRTYNSKSVENGWFGYGWGSVYETFLVVLPDGSVVVHENGSGAETRFIPKEAVNVEAASEKIIAAMKKQSNLSDSAVKTLKQRLATDLEQRQAYARKYGVDTQLPAGTVLYSNDRGIQTLTKEADGYKRVGAEGRVDFFDKDGKLAKITDKNGYGISFEYKEKKLVSIKDSQGKQLFFDWYPTGKLKAAWSVGDKKATYTYSAAGDLIESTDVEGNNYKYEYDARHNMTAINYKDGKKMQMKYDSKTQSALEVIEPNGDSTKYKYEFNPKNPEMHYWTTVIKKPKDGQEYSSRYEYELKSKPDGQQYTYRVATEVDSIKTETIYSECCGLPLKITRGKDVTTFEYNAKGLLTKKTSTRGEYVELAYDDKLNKITKVVNNEGMTNFKYDNQGNLVQADNSQGKSVLLIYDRNGKITRMIDNDKAANTKRALNFKYNSLGKPVEIEMEGVGLINVAYDNYGEIKKVESKAGAKMALQVTQAFQTLLSIVKPAGVNLNM